MRRARTFEVVSERRSSEGLAVRHDMVEALRATGSGPLELRETHISWVLLGPHEVLKLKKPVDYGFLDFSTPDRRKAACEAEVTLNRRLAPDVYLGVQEVTRDAEGTYALEGEGEVVDYAVRMRRLPDEDRGDRRLARGALADRHLRGLAEALAAFHRRADSGPEIAARGTAAAVAISVRENFEQTRAHLGRLLGPDEAQQLERWQLEVLEAQAELFSARAAAGRVRDGHGDLRLDHVYFDARDQLRVLDCIEFSDRLRHVDVACDVAFLAMDLGVHERVDLAERFLALYAEASGDFDLYALIDFYESYRAFVRGKITCFGLDEPDLPRAERLATEQQARRYFRLALASERRALLPPTLIGVSGVIGSGKSTLADALSRRNGAPVIASDRTRKALAGAAATDRLGPEAYRPEASEQVYDELIRRAEVVLGSGRSAILDASFSRAVDRRRLVRLAAKMKVGLRVVECRADAELARARLTERRARGGAVSDAGPELYQGFAAGFEPLTELPSGVHRAVDTSAATAETVAGLDGFIPMWPQCQRDHSSS